MKPFQYRRVTRILTRLVQAIPFGGGPIHQPKRHRDDSAGDDARAELRQTSSALPTVLGIAKRPKDETDRKQGDRSRDQESGVTETMGPLAFCHGGNVPGDDTRGAVPRSVGVSIAPSEGRTAPMRSIPAGGVRRGRTMSPTHPEDLRDLALRRSGNRPQGTVPTPGAMRRKV